MLCFGEKINTISMNSFDKEIFSVYLSLFRLPCVCTGTVKFLNLSNEFMSATKHVLTSSSSWNCQCCVRLNDAMTARSSGSQNIVYACD